LVVQEVLEVVALRLLAAAAPEVLVVEEVQEAAREAEDPALEALAPEHPAVAEVLDNRQARRRAQLVDHLRRGLLLLVVRGGWNVAMGHLLGWLLLLLGA